MLLALPFPRGSVAVAASGVTAGAVLVAVARYLAAHAPTSRAMLQTAKTAIRLHRGEAIYEAPAGADDTVG